MASAFNPTSAWNISASGRRVSPLDGVDPRTRVVAVILISFAFAAFSKLPTLGLALGLVVAGASLLGVWKQGRLKRLIPVNVFVLLLFVLLPLRGDPAAGAASGGFAAADEGLRMAVVIALKANAIVLSVIVLLGGLDNAVLGHALGHLGFPQKLTHLLLFTIRYLDVLHREYLRMRDAMRVRGFRPTLNWHTYRTVGHLVGMLLVRSVDRSERILAAMKCRGFQGRFYLLNHFAFSARDAWFAAAVLSALSILAVLEWS